MGSFDFSNGDSRIYRVTSRMAYAYAAILLLFCIYKETFFVDGTWFHGFFTMFFSIFSSVFMIVILFIFSKFIDTTLKYKNISIFIYVHIFFIFLTMAAVLPVLISGLEVYHSLQTDEDVSSLMNFGETSTSSAVLLIVSRIGSFITAIMLGFQIRKIRFGEKSFFAILGVLFIVYKLISVVEAVNLIRSEILSGLLNVAIVSLIAYILSRSVDANKNVFNSLNTEYSPQTTTDYLDTMSYENSGSSTVSSENTTPTTLIESNPTEPDTAPLDHSAYRDDSVNYYKNLPEAEKTRLHYIVTKNNVGLSESEVYEHVIRYISEKKLFDTNRFAP